MELVHGDLCGPIVLAMPRDNKELLVDDLIRYMWVAAIYSKDHAVAAIKKIQTQANGEPGHNWRAL